MVRKWGRMRYWCCPLLGGTAAEEGVPKVDEYNDKLKEVEDVCNPIVAQACATCLLSCQAKLFFVAVTCLVAPLLPLNQVRPDSQLICAHRCTCKDASYYLHTIKHSPHIHACAHRCTSKGVAARMRGLMKMWGIMTSCKARACFLRSHPHCLFSASTQSGRSGCQSLPDPLPARPCLMPQRLSHMGHARLGYSAMGPVSG
eukprot:scaffold126430_cov15-Tisochrysis_lutea.AAC.1